MAKAFVTLLVLLPLVSCGSIDKPLRRSKAIQLLGLTPDRDIAGESDIRSSYRKKSSTINSTLDSLYDQREALDKSAQPLKEAQEAQLASIERKIRKYESELEDLADDSASFSDKADGKGRVGNRSNLNSLKSERAYQAALAAKLMSVDK